MKSRVGVPGAGLASRPETAIGTKWKDAEKSGDGKLPWIRHSVLDNVRSGSIAHSWTENDGHGRLATSLLKIGSIEIGRNPVFPDISRV